jgi:hypothetical protein
MNSRTLAALLVLAAACLPAACLAQQQAIRGQTVFERGRPEFAPVGLGLGSFRARPYLEVSESYDDNILATPDDAEGDFVTVVEAGMSVRSNWSNHALGAAVYGRANRFLDNSDESTDEGGALLSGRLDVTRNDRLAGSTAYRRETESRTDPEEGDGAEPSQLDRYIARLSYTGQFSRLLFVANSLAQRHDYVTDDDQFRDRNEYRLAPRLYYEWSPAFKPFVEAAYARVDYDALEPRRGLDRDSDTASGFVGAEFDLTGALTSEAFFGYFRTGFDDSRLDEVDGLGGGGSLTWLVTGLTSVLAEASRGVEQTTRANASNKIRTLGKLRVEHELLRNVLLDSEIRYVQDEFEGIDRFDDTWSLELGADYLLNRYARLSLGYIHVRRQSDDPTAEFSKNVVFVSSRLTF